MDLQRTVQWVAQILNTSPVGAQAPHAGAVELREVVVDSRDTIVRDSLFVALRGANFDGHAFVERAFARGAAAALVDQAFARELPPNAPHLYIAVEDTRAALQALARAWRQGFAGPVVGITGSNGKTIVKDMLAAILSQGRTVHRSPGSYNSQVGVPLSLLGLRAEHEMAVIEAGISQRHEMARLAAMIAPTLGVLTNIGAAHAAGLGDLGCTAREKLQLFSHFTGEPLVYLAEDPTLGAMRALLPGRPVPVSVLGAQGWQPGVVAVTQVEMGRGHTAFQMRMADGTALSLELYVPGEHNVVNAALAAAAAWELGATAQDIRTGLAGFEPSAMRLEMHTTDQGITLINDAYNSDPVSARAALGVLQHYAGGQRTVAILGEMLDLGATAPGAHRDLGELVARTHVDRLVCLGPMAALAAEAARAHGLPPEHVHCLEDLEDLRHLLADLLQPGDVVLFKASRSVGLERAANDLIESVAPTRLFIDLDAIRDNFQALRQEVGPQTHIMAVVKSYGYGNDAVRVSQTLVQQGVNALAVAYPDEAIPLRRRGVAHPILVTNVMAAEADKVVKYGLTALVYSHRVAEALQREAERHGAIVDVHLEVDTGMHRVGLAPSEVASFAQWLGDLPHLRLEGVMTHFAVADDPGEDAFTERQMAAFEQVLADLETRGIAVKVVHAANTAGAWRFGRARHNMVRMGLGLYGLYPSLAVSRQAQGITRPALRLTTRVIHLHEVPPGESVSYGRSWRAGRATRVATIAAGYNDGLPRYLSNRGEVLVRGVRCPIVGRVCMDVTMVDVTQVPGVEVGDEVLLFGTTEAGSIAVEEWAELGDTISYEILCNISPRVRRIFVRTR